MPHLCVDVVQRRAHTRHDHCLPVEVRCGRQHLEGVTRNIGIGGIYLVTPRELGYGKEVELTFRLPAIREPVTVSATVRWCCPDGVGLQFGPLPARVVWGLNRLFAASRDGG